MSSIMTPDNIRAALESLTNELPSLIGDDWENIKGNFDILNQRLHDSNDPEERDRLASELVDILIPYKDARDGLKEHIRFQHIRAVLRDTIDIDIPAFAEKIGLDNKIVEPSVAIVMKSIVLEEAGVRLIKIKEDGIEPAKSVKICNFHLDLFTMAELIATTVITTADPVVAGVLILIGTLTKIPEAMTIELSEQDTSVFWGFVLARDADNSAEESLIAKHTNDERKKNGRMPLTNEGVRDALSRLEKLKCIELVEGKQDTWRIVEKYEIT